MKKQAANNNSEDEKDLIERSREGDADAFGELARRYRRRVLGLCIQIIGDVEIGEDVTQETFIRAFHGIKHFHMKSRFYTWLYRIAVNLSINAMRKQYSQKSIRLSDPSENSLENVHSFHDSTVVEDIEQQEVHEAIEKGLAQLPPSQREVMRLFDLEGLTYAEIAEKLHLNLGTVRSRLHYARKKMCDFLTGHVNA